MSSSDAGFEWTFRGRLNRAKYLGQILSVYACIAVVAIAARLFVAAGGGSYEMRAGAGGLVGLMGAPVFAIPIVRRLHDLNRPGWNCWFMLIPIYNIALGIILLFQRGTKGPNRYGSDPLANTRVLSASQPASEHAPASVSERLGKTHATHSGVRARWVCGQCGKAYPSLAHFASRSGGSDLVCERCSDYAAGTLVADPRQEAVVTSYSQAPGSRGIQVAPWDCPACANRNTSVDCVRCGYARDGQAHKAA